MKKIIVGIFALSLGITSCNKSNKIDITIFNPEAGKSYTSPVPFEVNIETKKSLIHDLEVKVYQKSNSDIKLYDFDTHIDEAQYLLKDSLYANVTVPTVFVLEIEAGDNAEVHKRIEFTITP